MKIKFFDLIPTNKENIFWIGIFCIILFSINVSPYEICQVKNLYLNLNICQIEKELNLSSNFLNSLRVLFFLTSAFFILLKLIFNFKKVHLNNNRNIILLLLITNFLVQIFSTFLNYEINYIINEPKLFHGIYLNFSAIILCIFFLIIDNEKLFFQTLIIFALALFSFYIPFSIIIFFDWLTSERQAMYYSSYIQHGSLFLDNPVPRSTGIARIVLIFFIASLTLKIYYPKNIFNTLLIFFFSFLIISFQSRFSVFMMPIIIFLFEFLKGFNFKNLTKNIFIFLLIPFLLSNTVNLTKFYFKSDGNSKKEKIIEAKERTNEGSRFFYGIVNTEASFKSNDRAEVFTSGRATIWKEAIKKLNSKYFFTGYGAHSDRLLLNDGKYKNFGNNISNTYLYAIFSGGILSIFLIVTFNVFVLIAIFKNFISNRFLSILFTLIIFTFFTRGLLEISYGFFGIDLLIILFSAQYFYYNPRLEK